MRVSVIATVMNEGASIQRLLDSLAAQTRPPDQIVIVDGGSSDDTVSRLRAHALCRRGTLIVLVAPGANISRGRNLAIQAADGPIIAATDAGVRLDPAWLEQLTQPFDQASAPDVVSGFFLPDPHSTFEVAMSATVLPTVSDVDPERFWPSSRSVAFRKAAWEAVGGYPEWLDYCEDLLFDFALRHVGCRFLFQPKALVYFRPRGSLRAFFKQYYRYARGDGKSDIWRQRHLVRYGTYLLLLPTLLALAIWHSSWWGLALLLGLAAMLRTPYRRLWPMLPGLAPLERLKALCWVPVIRVTGDIAKMIGYPVGLGWRRQHHAHIPNDYPRP